MKVINSLTLAAIVLLLLFLMNCNNAFEKQDTDRSVIVHYVANEGFLLENNGKKVLIDALFNTGLDRYACPDSSLLSNMIQANSPFEDIDFLIFTHNHPDHFNDSLAYAFLSKHKETQMICPNQVTEQLHQNQMLMPDIESRIHIITPDSGQVEDQMIENLNFKVCRTKHSDTYSIENNAYVIDFGGVKVFHSGDSWKEAMNDWPGFDLKAENIDLALVNGFYAGDGYKLLNEKMSPKQIILMHMKNEHLEMFTDIMAKDTAVFHNSTLFKKSMETKSFQF